MIEIEYYRTGSSGRKLRRQLLQVVDGWTLSNGEEVGVGPKSLRGYKVGWEWGSKVYPTRKAAERNLAQNRWHLEGEEPYSSESRNRSPRDRGDGLVAVEVRISPEQRDAIDTEAERLRLSRTATVAKWADSLVKKKSKKIRQARSK